MMRFWKKTKKIIAGIFLLFIIILFSVYLINILINKAGDGSMYGTDNIPRKQVVLVLGARVWPDGKMSDMFQDRVDVALDLYKSGKAGKILVSGDHERKDYDEVDTARNYLLANGVKEEDLFLDHAGFDTYDSVYRAKHIFQAQSIIIVSQKYHLPRALYVAKNIGIDAVGAPADLRIYGGQDYRDFREKLADVKAWLDVFLKVKPRFSGNPVPITGSSALSWG